MNISPPYTYMYELTGKLIPKTGMNKFNGSDKEKRRMFREIGRRLLSDLGADWCGELFVFIL